MRREVQEELGVPAQEASSDFEIVHYTLGKVVNGVPRMNLFFKVSVPEVRLTKTNHVAAWAWLTRDEFMKAPMNDSYNKAELSAVIFGI